MKLEVVLPDDVERVTDLLYGAKDPEWEFIEEKINSVDGEKSITYKTIILKRKEDEAFFKFECVENNYHSLDKINKWPMIGERVFPIVVSTTHYK